MRPLVSFGWHDVVFEHYRVTDDAALASRVPPPLTLDRLDRTAYVSVVSLRVTDQRLLGVVALPTARSYLQVNVRTYVRCEGRRGLLFLQNVVSSRLAAILGRVGYGVPNRHGAVRGSDPAAAGVLAYEASLAGSPVHRIAGRHGAAVEPGSPLITFLTARHLQWGQVGPMMLEGEVEHPPWHLATLEVRERNHALIRELGLEHEVEPVAEVHWSTGVEAVMRAPRPLPRPRPVPARTFSV
jgi:uncharacterized protein